jgi:peptidyl-prolyl cis-trans isomerase B (cyclophilin B)
MIKTLILTVFCLISLSVPALAQPAVKPLPTPTASTKINQRPTKKSTEPYENATVEMMSKQCVRLETEAGSIELEMFPESAPETVRNFLNLVAMKAYDTTKFTRVVPNFIVQGGNISTRDIKTPELMQRARRTIADEPSQIKHERGILSMARPETPNGASTHFFILLRDSPHLDGSFTAFGRVTTGLEIVEKINQMPVEGDKPVNPVKLTRAVIFPCVVQPNPTDK